MSATLPAARRTPVSPAQAGLWFASVHADDPTAYNQPLVLTLPRLLDHDLLDSALRHVQREHESLRTTFEMNDEGTVCQLVHDGLDPVVELREHPGAVPGDWVAAQVDEIAGTVFDLGAGPLVRIRHLRLTGAGHSRLVCNVHHTVFDGMSWKPYLGRVEEVYGLLADGERPEVAEPRQAGQAYAHWTDRLSAGRERALAYWRDKLAGPPAAPEIGLPADGDAAPRHHTRSVELTPELTARIREFCAAQRITTSMFHTALFATLLHRQTGRDDVLIGMPVTVRAGADAEVVGHLTNTVTLRSRPEQGETAAGALAGIRTELLDVLRHRHLPLDAVVDDLRAAGGRGGSAEPFSAMITVMPAAARRLDLRRWGVETWEYTPGGAKYDLVLVVDEAPDRHVLIVEHTSSTDGAGEFTELVAARLAALVEQVLDAPDTPLDELDRPDPRTDPVIAGLARRDEAAELGTERTADLFASVAGAAGDTPAVVADGVTTGYAELARRVDAVAAGLAARGVRDGRRVAVLLRPGLDLLVTVLGVLRAGGAYVTMDPAHPAERIRFAVDDCGPDVLVAADPPLAPPGVPVITPGELASSGAPFDPAGRKGAGDAAYVVYTSGSTGSPKGVEITEATLANLVHNQDLLSGGRPMRTLQYMTPSFDVFAEEAFGTLCTGGTLVVPPATARTDFTELSALLAEQRIERVFLPYVALRELAAVLKDPGHELGDLREVYTTGERLVVTDDVRAMFRSRPGARLGNIYGPSEAHLCTAERLPADPDDWPALPSIGTAVRGVDVRVLDGDRPVPVGAEGELCVAGPVVSPGYLGLPDRTATSMVEDPVVPGQRMYRTGDVVVLGPDGRLHYRGRADDQVKIRGFRVEPAEVEAALERVFGVDAAAVLAVPAGADRVLHGVVTSATDLPEDWRVRLAAVLPAHLLPARLTRVDSIPVTPNGKTDRASLAQRYTAPGGDGDGVVPAIAPLSGIEAGRQRELAGLWAEVLGAPPASADDDFFLLGGHSLLAARLHRAVRERFDVDVPLSALLSTPTLRGMADVIDGDGRADALDLRADATLPEGFAVARTHARTGDTVLLTGATGFLGVHLLDELVRAGRRVLCLVRAGDEQQARERLRAACTGYGLGPATADAAQVWPGDLIDGGLRPEADLGGEIGEVYHAAAHINFVAPYRTVRRTNVDGLVHLLEFCAALRVPLRLVSTLGVFPPDSTAGTVDERTVPGDPASLGIGYSQSKWVAEHLALAARAAGVPLTVHRIGRIGGHSATGACRPDDFFWLQMKGIAELGSYSEDLTAMPPVDLLPVDHVARAVVLLSDHDGDGRGSIWHLHNTGGLAWPEILDCVREQGYPVAATDRASWLAALESAPGDRGLAPLVPLMVEGVMRLGTHDFDNDRTARVLAGLGHPVPAGDPAWLHRMFAYFRSRGAVAAPAAPGTGRDRQERHHG